MWTEITRTQHRRDDLRHASDMTDAEWALVEPHMPGAGKSFGLSALRHGLVSRRPQLCSAKTCTRSNRP